MWSPFRLKSGGLSLSGASGFEVSSLTSSKACIPSSIQGKVHSSSGPRRSFFRVLTYLRWSLCFISDDVLWFNWQLSVFFLGGTSNKGAHATLWLPSEKWWNTAIIVPSSWFYGDWAMLNHSQVEHWLSSINARVWQACCEKACVTGHAWGYHFQIREWLSCLLLESISLLTSTVRQEIS